MAEPLTTGDDFSPLYRQVRDQVEGRNWEATVTQSRRPTLAQTPQDIQVLVREIAPQYNVDPLLVEAVMGLESGGNPRAVSRKGAEGLLQLMPATGKRFGVTNPYDPAQNITGGIRYLAYLRDQFPGRVDLQLAGYHAGEGAVKKHGNTIPPTDDGNMTTQAYVDTILGRYSALKGRPYVSKQGPAGLPGVPGADFAAAFPSRTTTMEDPQAATAGAPLPSVGTVDAKLAQPESQRYLPTADQQVSLQDRATAQQVAFQDRATARPQSATGTVTQRPVGLAQPFIPTEGVEEAQPTRAVGMFGTAAVGAVRQSFEAIPLLSNWAQGRNQPGVIAALGTLGEDISAILDPVEKGLKPTIIGDPTLWDKTASAFGSTAPGLLLGAIAGGGLVGAGVSAITEAGQEAVEVQRQLTPLVGQAEADRRAMKSFGLNLALVGITDRLGIFSGSTKPLRKAIATVAMNDLQEIVQYDIERRQMWVPASSPYAKNLELQGWIREGDRVAQPVVAKDLGEVALIASIIGTTMGSVMGRAMLKDNARVEAALHEAQANSEGFTLERGLEALQHPEEPADGVELPAWKRWAQAMLDMLPEPGGGGPLRRTLGNQRGSLDLFGSPPVTPSAEATPAVEPQPTLRGGAEGLTPDRYKTPDGRWVIPLRDMPPQELELLDFIRQPKPGAPYGGIKLAGEELSGDFERFVRQRESGEYRLLNDTSGLSVQAMADAAHEAGFIPTADKESLLTALDRSISLGQPVYSQYATGAVPLLDDPHVQGAYRAVLDAVDAMGPRTEEQVAGVRNRQERHAEAAAWIENGQYTLDDVRDLYPNTVLDDTQASALLQSVHKVGVEVGNAAIAYIESGAKVGSREEASLQQTMAMLAQLDPYRLGASAAASRALGIFNDPLSGYTQYLNNLHAVLEGSGERTMQQIATKLAAAQREAERGGLPEGFPAARDAAYWKEHPEELDALFQEIRDRIANQASVPFQLRPDEEALRLQPLTDEEHALVAASYRTEGAALTPAEWQQRYRDRQLALAKEEEARGTIAYRAWLADERAKLPAPLQLEAESPGNLPTRQTPEQQALIDAAYTSERAALTSEEWASRERDRQFAQARIAERQADLQWRIDARHFQQLEAARQASTTRWEPTPMDAALLQRLDLALRPYTGLQQQLVMKALVQSARPGFEGYFLELLYNAQLSNPATHAANVLGNMGSTLWSIPERFIAANFDSPGGVQQGEATAMLYGLVHGLHDAWTIAARSFQAGQALSGMSKGELRQPAMTAENVGIDPQSGLGRFFDFWFEYIGAGSGGRLPTRLLMASDEFAKMLNYRAELNAQAYREATRLGYEGSAWAEHVQRVVSSPALAVMEQAARDFSITQTFQGVLAPWVPGSEQRMTLGGAMQAFSNINMQGFPVGRMILPYVQTPANIAKYAMERTPLGFFFRSVQDDIAAGGARGDIAKAKIHLGTITMATMAGLAMTGKLVGRAPEDPTLREMFLQQHPEYSLNVWGKFWVSLDRFEPISMLATYVADAVQIAGDVSVPEYERGIAMLWYPFLKNITSKTYMRGLSDFFDAASPHPGRTPESDLERSFRYARRQLVGLAQPSSLVASVARAIDPVEKDMKTLMDAWYARIPWARNGVPALRTLGGEKILTGWGFEPEWLANTVRAYVPFRMGQDQLSPIDKDILNQKMRISRVPRHLASYAVRPGEEAESHAELDMTAYGDLSLTPREHEEYKVLAGGNQREAKELGLVLPDAALAMVIGRLTQVLSESPPKSAMSLDEYLNWFRTTERYQEASPGRGGGQEQLVQHAVIQYRDMARDVMLAHHPQLRTQYDETHIQHQIKKLPVGQREERARALRDERQGRHERRYDDLGLPPPQAPATARIGIGG